MNVTPMNAARFANARRHVSHVLTGRLCPNPEQTAQHVMDELRKLGWAPPGWHDDESMSQPTYSTPQGRARAREIYEQTRRDGRRSSAGTDTTRDDKK